MPFPILCKMQLKSARLFQANSRSLNRWRSEDSAITAAEPKASPWDSLRLPTFLQDEPCSVRCTNADSWENRHPFRRKPFAPGSRARPYSNKGLRNEHI